MPSRLHSLQTGPVYRAMCYFAIPRDYVLVNNSKRFDLSFDVSLGLSCCRRGAKPLAPLPHTVKGAGARCA